MRWTVRCLLILMTLPAILGPVAADPGLQLGYREDTALIPDDDDGCSEGTLLFNHDETCENGYCWDFGWQPPMYGAYAEGFDFGPGTLVCASYWFTQIGYFMGEPMDCYVWEGGVSGEPGEVLCLLNGIVPTQIPFWPECGQIDVEINCCVETEFTVGWWADFSDQVCQWYVCADENGPGGHPWTYVAPGLGYPTGWNPVTVVYPNCVSLCIGAYLADEPSPAEARTWGAVKALFEREPGGER